MNTEPIMYVLVRKDLAETYRLVQGSHAVAEYSFRGNQECYQKWNNTTIMFLGVRNEQALILWSMRLADHKKPFVVWSEPDMRGQMTSIACIDTGEIFKKLRMA